MSRSAPGLGASIWSGSHCTNLVEEKKTRAICHKVACVLVRPCKPSFQLVVRSPMSHMLRCISYAESLRMGCRWFWQHRKRVRTGCLRTAWQCRLGTVSWIRRQRVWPAYDARSASLFFKYISHGSRSNFSCFRGFGFLLVHLDFYSYITIRVWSAFNPR